MPLPEPSAADLQLLQQQLSRHAAGRGDGDSGRPLQAGALFLQAPLAANVNDKDNAFGGSLASLMTLAGWGWVNLQLRAGRAQRRHLCGRQPVALSVAGLRNLARRRRAGPTGAERDTFVATLRQRGKARLGMAAQVRLADGAVAATFSGRFVAIAKG